jgi:hypothetical protein
MLIGLKQMLAGKKWNIGMVQNLQLSSHTHWQNTVQVVRFTPDSFQRNQLIWREMSSYHPTFQVKRCAKHERETTARICWKQHLLKKNQAINSGQLSNPSILRLRCGVSGLRYVGEVSNIPPFLDAKNVYHRLVFVLLKNSGRLKKHIGLGNLHMGLWKNWRKPTNQRCGRVPEGQHIGQSKGVSKRWKNPWSHWSPLLL